MGDDVTGGWDGLQTYYRWKQQYGGAQGDQQVKVKELERQNARLKKIVAEQAMDIDALKDLDSKKARLRARANVGVARFRHAPRSSHG